MSTNMSFRPIYAKRSTSLLKQSTILCHLTDKASLLSHLQNRINLYLPAIMQENCAVASYQDKILTIMTTQAYWATRLRYQQQHLTKQLLKHSEFYGIERIVVKVFPKSSPKIKEQHPLLMSHQTAQIIRETADFIQHPKLKAALTRLANHSK